MTKSRVTGNSGYGDLNETWRIDKLIRLKEFLLFCSFWGSENKLALKYCSKYKRATQTSLEL